MYQYAFRMHKGTVLHVEAYCELEYNVLVQYYEVM